jgi:hypothetical protein
VAERIVPRGNVAGDRLLEALVELARSAIRNDRAAGDRRAKLTVVDGGRRAA